MKYRQRTFCTDRQKSEMWDRWQRGGSLSPIGHRFDRASSSIFRHLAITGGIRPPNRTRSRFALTLMEREEISRGLAVSQSIARFAQLGERCGARAFHGQSAGSPKRRASGVSRGAF
ncbi:MAG: hypothetical protein ACI8R4_001712 [Paracoccaceae bacterium]|jgi:hypothetical protein